MVNNRAVVKANDLISDALYKNFKKENDKDRERLENAYAGKELKENESICVECNKKINDDLETQWNEHGEPICQQCNNLCECGNPRMDESDFCKDCI